MKKHISLLILAAMVALFTGCATRGPLYPTVKNSASLTPPKDKGLVIIYCALHGGSKFTIYGNDQMLTNVMIGTSFYAAFCNPGPYRLSSGKGIKPGDVTAAAIGGVLTGGILGGVLNGEMEGGQQKRDWVTINVEPGQQYYVRIKMGWVREHLEQVPAAQGERELRDCHWLNPTNP